MIFLFVLPTPDNSNRVITGYLPDIYHLGGIARHDLVNGRLRCLRPVATLSGNTISPSDQSCAICNDDDWNGDGDEISTRIRGRFLSEGGEFQDARGLRNTVGYFTQRYSIKTAPVWHQCHATKGSKGVLKLFCNQLTDLPQSDQNGPPDLEAVQLILSVRRQYIDSVIGNTVPSKLSTERWRVLVGIKFRLGIGECNCGNGVWSFCLYWSELKRCTTRRAEIMKHGIRSSVNLGLGLEILLSSASSSSVGTSAYTPKAVPRFRQIMS